MKLLRTSTSHDARRSVAAKLLDLRGPRLPTPPGVLRAARSASLALLVTLGAACSAGTPEEGVLSSQDAVGDGATGSKAPPDDARDDAPSGGPDAPVCGAYSEALPSRASLEGLSFSSTRAGEYLLGALERRYPLGKLIIDGARAGSDDDCVGAFLSDTSDRDAVLRDASTVVHECGHFLDLDQAGATSSVYVVRSDLRFTCEGGAAADVGGQTFARSRIAGDEFARARPPCGGDEAAEGCDYYADVYLDGDPDDAEFQSGDQGYDLVLEEALQYVNSLASALAFRESYAGTGGASERDGILTFLWYVERYLAYAEAHDPAAYALLSEDACWRRATLTVWDRAWFYLDATKSVPDLGFEDAEIERLVKDPRLTAQIDALRAIDCGAP